MALEQVLYGICLVFYPFLLFSEVSVNIRRSLSQGAYHT